MSRKERRRIHGPLLSLARIFLNDVWRASEITEAAVHSVWQKHRHDLGFHPSSRFYTAARWAARDAKAGGWHSRRAILQSFDDLEEVVRKKGLIDPENYTQTYAEGLYFECLCEELESEGLDDVSEMFKLLLTGCTWDEIGRQLGKHPDSSRIRFCRWTRRLLGRFRDNQA